GPPPAGAHRVVIVAALQPRDRRGRRGHLPRHRGAVQPRPGRGMDQRTKWAHRAGRADRQRRLVRAACRAAVGWHRAPPVGTFDDGSAGMSRQWFAAGVVEAPVNAVFAALLAAGPAADAHHNPAHNTNASGDSDAILRYQAPIGSPPYTATVEVDQKRHTLAIQGHWWYRGVYTVREDPRGSLVRSEEHTSELQSP